MMFWTTKSPFTSLKHNRFRSRISQVLVMSALVLTACSDSQSRLPASTEVSDPGAFVDPSAPPHRDTDLRMYGDPDLGDPGHAKTAGDPSLTGQACSDPKTCGEPKFPLDAGISSTGCIDPKTCGEPGHEPKITTDAGVSSAGCIDPKTCGEPGLVNPGPQPPSGASTLSTDAGVPGTGCIDPKTCGEPGLVDPR